MKLGILAFQNAINYGAILQIYALSKTLKSILGEELDIEIINYIQSEIEQQYAFQKRRGNIFVDFTRNLVYYPSNKLKRNRFESFIKNHLNLSPKVGSPSDLNKYDAVIVGSDQVWNSSIQNYDTMYLFDGVDSKVKKISYAASIGKNTLDKKDENIFERHLDNFDYISVREKKAKELIDHLTKNKIEVTLDPTLLLTKEEWQNVAKKENKEKDYILVYSLQNNEELVKIANRVSEKTNKKLKFIKPFGQSVLQRASTEYSYGPAEYLDLFNNASYVVTNSFHGTCFSVLYNKNFVTIPHRERGIRMTDLLDSLNLNHRYVYSLNEFDQADLLSNEDFTEANTLLDIQRGNSLNFLENALSYRIEK